ncbi:MAG: NAD+ synthase [Verrucomicrobiae bacterium]|nr:NAD+ synthase [Verrucomicrobiae bacterium]MCP5539681.1 NAD+ synthase [Akkermansiaceae bacterium]MCP5549420.1 NAD+ synthase [Akkermansiaceae bacterium]
MKIGLCQINPTIGDFAGNAEKILRSYRECVDAGADLVLTPELAICGYPPRDLIYRSRFVPRCLETLERIAADAGDVPLLTGYVDFSPSETGPRHRNAAALLQNGAVVRRFGKCLLPTYDVFDEARYFQPADEVGIFEAAGRRVGVTICEDIWTEDYLPAKLYVKNPPAALAEGGADLIVNLSASPFHAGKPGQRVAMLAGVSRSTKCPVVYCNAVGGNDQLVFDGHSVVTAADGSVLARLAGFREETRVVDLSKAGDSGARDAWESCEAEEIFEALALGVRDYLGKCGFRSAVIGLSGGIDSALTAAIAAHALGPVNVLGVTMPTQYSSEGSVADSLALAKNLGIHCRQVPIQEIFESVKTTTRPVFEGRPEDVTEENMQSRIRGLLLMAVANKLGHLLLTTGNKSELAVGYCTIYGDMCGGLAVISDLPKVRVYEVSRWLNRDREIIPWNTIDKPPSAELRPDQKDEDSLPPYEILDAILERYVERHESVPDIVAAGFEADTVNWVARAVDLNEWKRQQAAPGLRVTSKAFGMGRRFPIAQRYRDSR